MMDALAADHRLGESPTEMFAFGGCPAGGEQKSAIEWRAKNMTPILYDDRDHHSNLHETLRAWAETSSAISRSPCLPTNISGCSERIDARHSRWPNTSNIHPIATKTTSK